MDCVLNPWRDGRWVSRRDDTIEADLAAAWPLLDDRQRDVLRDGVRRQHGAEHPCGSGSRTTVEADAVPWKTP